MTRGGERGHALFMGRNPLTIRADRPANSPGDLQNSAAINFHLKAAGPVTIEIGELAGPRKFTAKVAGEAGLNRYDWPLRYDPAAVSTATPAAAGAPAGAGAAAGAGAGGGRGAGAGAGAAGGAGSGEQEGGPGTRRGPVAPTVGAGTYVVRLTAGGKTLTSTIVVREDPAFGLK